MHPENGSDDPRRLGYFIDTASSLFPVIRAIALLCVVFGLLRLIFVPVDIVNLRRQWAYGAIPQTEFLRINWIGSVVAAVFFSATLVMGGSGCLRLRPYGRRTLITWAWLSLGYVVYGAAVNAGYSVMGTPAAANRIEPFFQVALRLKQWLPSLVLPLTVLAILTRRTVSALFETGESARGTTSNSQS